MKKLINAPDAVVSEALIGMEAAHRELSIDHELQIIYRSEAPVTGKVGVISGGGSGHEPMHGGLVGYGMLHAACPGEVFTSPTPDQMLESTKVVNGGAGVLHSLLQPLADHGVVMTFIESRPSRRKNWDYVFFIDIEGHADESPVADALADLERASSLFRVLGAYPKAVG